MEEFNIKAEDLTAFGGGDSNPVTRNGYETVCDVSVEAYTWPLYRLIADKSVATFARLARDNATVVMRGKKHMSRTSMPASEFFALYERDDSHPGIFGSPV